MASILHIVFCDRAARVLRQALKETGRPDQVIWFPDDLGVGPIDPPDPATREVWVSREFAIACAEWNWPIGMVERFWRSALGARRRRVIWVSRRVVAEYTGFLEFIRRAGDGSYDVVDVSEALAGRDGDPEWRQLRPVTLGDIYDQPATVRALLAKAQPLTPAQRDADRALWAGLRAENAPLRALTEYGLSSVALSHFDELLLSCVVAQWRKTARILGDALLRSSAGGFHQVRLVVLAARIRALAGAGRLDSRGDLCRIRYSEVRLPGTGGGCPAPAPDQLASSSVSQ